MYSYPAPYYDHSYYAEQQEESKTERKFTHPPFLLQVTGLPLFCSENCQQRNNNNNNNNNNNKTRNCILRNVTYNFPTTFFAVY